MKILEAKYIQAGYRVVDFLSERVKKERDLRPRDVQRLLVKNALNETLS